jgi:hypothetical protein
MPMSREKKTEWQRVDRQNNPHKYNAAGGCYRKSHPERVRAKNRWQNAARYASVAAHYLLRSTTEQV